MIAYLQRIMEPGNPKERRENVKPVQLKKVLWMGKIMVYMVNFISNNNIDGDTNLKKKGVKRSRNSAADGVKQNKSGKKVNEK